MKPINCTQCGATIENVSEHSLIVECQYCGARIMMPGGEKKVSPSVQVAPPDLEVEATSFPPFVRIGIVAAIAILLPALLILFASTRREAKSSSDFDYKIAAQPSVYPTPSSWTVSTEVPEKPMPVVRYQPRVSWDGPNDIEHFEDPEVDVSSLSHLTSEEVEKTVFKNRVVKLRVVINTEGEIDEVETISGHPILVAASTESAKRSIFSSRSKPTKRVLTYTFRVLKD